MSWKVFFHGDQVDPGRGHSDPVVLRHLDVLERASVRRRRPGQPFLLDPLGAADLRVNRWFESDEIRGLEPATWRKYAFGLVVWLTFLSSYGRPWDDTDEDAQEAFKVWRVQDERNPRTVAPGTYGDNLTAMQLFYGWASAEYGIRNPIRTRRGRGRRWDGSVPERPVTAPKATRDRDVKWFDPAGYERYRDVGLLGLTLDGEEDRSWRGRTGQRNGAFADGLYGTGLRLEEWGSVLLVELPPDDPSRGFYTCHLAEQTAKGKRSRRYWMPRRTLLGTLNYCDGERASAVRRGQAEGRYERMQGARVLVRVLAGRRARLRSADGSVSEVSLDALRPAARRRLLRETPEGLEPVALWLNEDGLPRDPHGWEHTFTEANKRLAALGLVGFAGAAHMLRHSFALRWYSVGRLLYDKRLAHLDEQEQRDFRHEFGSTWDLVQLLLGHLDQRTTKETYLEPFQALELELLLMHAEHSGIPDLMAAVFGPDRRVLGDPLTVPR
ncbi:hypothetical protein [Kitasatospora sp. NPDC002040]|uniref:hypothetical protein n=1 Tax=Kitasatospora sp. NPDC002040 TaxID=3154661 RepID=UPI00332D727A